MRGHLAAQFSKDHLAAEADLFLKLNRHIAHSLDMWSFSFHAFQKCVLHI